MNTMKALLTRDLEAILQKKKFIEWWQNLVDLEEKLTEVRLRHEELLAQANLMNFRAEFTQKKAIDMLYLAGEHEDSAAQAMAEAADIENKSYEAVANFESQRIAVSDMFSRMDAKEHEILSLLTEVREVKASFIEAKDSEKKKELEGVLKKKEGEMSRKERDFRELSLDYEHEKNRKLSLWEEVEQMWSRSLNIILEASEKRIKSRTKHREAETLFKEAERHKINAQALDSEVLEAEKEIEHYKKKIEELRILAQTLFGCMVGDAFLYWPVRQDNKKVFCVPIFSQSEGYNIELQSRHIYLIDRQRGVGFIEPLPPKGEIQEDEDSRIDEFFIRGR